MDFQNRAQAEMSMPYVNCSISRFLRVEGWKGGFSKKCPSGDVDDVILLFDFKGWKGGWVDFQKRAQAEMSTV